MEERPSRNDVELYLLRHADAVDPTDAPGADAQRPLTDLGRRQAQQLGRFLASRGVSVDAIVSSPKLRAAETARLVAEPLGRQVRTDDRLAEGLDLDALAAVIDDAAGKRVLVVGHDPDISDVCASLCDARELALKKCALARLDASLPLRPAEAVLRWLLPPEVIGPLA
jgi:phosphohistidine phosphatase